MAAPDTSLLTRAGNITLMLLGRSQSFVVDVHEEDAGEYGLGSAWRGLRVFDSN